MREAIDVELIRRAGALADGWSGGSHDYPRYKMRNGYKVAVVYLLETHGTDRGGYRAEIGPRTLDAYPRTVAEARDIADAALASEG